MAILAFSVAPSQTPPIVFVIDADGDSHRKSFRYLCGACGGSLSDHATAEVLECMFLCTVCDAINESPMEARAFRHSKS
jgi:hypothetical protein